MQQVHGHAAAEDSDQMLPDEADADGHMDAVMASEKLSGKSDGMTDGHGTPPQLAVLASLDQVCCAVPCFAVLCHPVLCHPVLCCCCAARCSAVPGTNGNHNMERSLTS